MKFALGLTAVAAVVTATALPDATIANTLNAMNSQLMQDSVAASSILDSITADNFAVMQPKVEASLNAVEDTIKQFMQEIANKNKSKRDSIEKRAATTASDAMKNVVMTMSNLAQKINIVTSTNSAFVNTANNYGTKYLAGLTNVFAFVNGGGGILGGLGQLINGNSAGAQAANNSGEGFLGLGCLCNAYLGNSGVFGAIFGGIFGDGSGCTGNLGLNGVLGGIGNLVGGASVGLVGNTGIDNSGAAVLPPGVFNVAGGTTNVNINIGVGGSLSQVLGGSYGNGQGYNAPLVGIFLAPGNNPYVSSNGQVVGGILIFPNQPGWTNGGMNCTPQFTSNGISIIYPGQGGYSLGCATCFGTSSTSTGAYSCNTGRCGGGAVAANFNKKRAVALR